MITILPLLVLLAASGGSAETHHFERLCAQVAADYDSARGGFVTKDGAPIESAVELGFALGGERGDPLWLARAHRTAEWMHVLYDSAGGGFFLRLRDADPSYASFEKPTRANARRLENLIDAWQHGGSDADRRAAARVADYMDRVLLDARGGFVAGQVGDRQLVPEANGYAIRAWLRWAGANGDPRLREFAWKSLDRVWQECWVEGLGLMRLDMFGRREGSPLLEDQCEMGRAFILAAHFGGREADLARARVLGNLVVERFEEPEKGGFAQYSRPRGDEGKAKRGGRKFDENARAVRFLAELASVTGKNEFRDAARRAIQVFERDLGRAREDAADWALALRALEASDLPSRPKWSEPPKAAPESPRVFRIRGRRR